MGELGSIPGLGKSPAEGKGYPFQYSVLENSMDCIVHRVAKSWTELSSFHFSHFFFHSTMKSIVVLIQYIQGLASRKQARITDWKREKDGRW